MIERFGLQGLRLLEPERAHGLALAALRTGLVPLPGPITSPRLVTSIAGLDLPNPIGLAAGFDKNATCIAPLQKAGFGFLEVGAVTPKPQLGNPKPRLFRLIEDHAVINRFGFNNAGMDNIAARLAARPNGVPLGLNLGANKDSTDRIADFAAVLETCGAFVDFATVNVSSPNTERLRDLQGPAALAALLERVMAARDSLNKPVPIFLKIAPDIGQSELTKIVDIALKTKVDALVATNTTIRREGLQSSWQTEAGGLSGAPLFAPSTRILAQMYQRAAGQIPILGVGGVDSAETAYTKIKAGAQAVQLYTAMVFQGISLIGQIVRGLDALLENDGFSSVQQAVGIDIDRWT